MSLSAHVRRIIFFSVIFFLCFFVAKSSQVFAQDSNSQYTVPNNNPDVPKNLHTYTQNVLLDVASALSCQIAGIDPLYPSEKCLGVDPVTRKIGFVNGNGGLLGITGNMIAMLYMPPLHSGDYVRYMANNFGLTKKAYAAGSIQSCNPNALQAKGVGFCSLIPLMPLWSAFRNVVYMIFVLLFMFIGVAIMLRVKIDPRTVMSIENQIPKIIIGLLLVTFSFAIAGFLIDIMYIFMYLLYGLFSNIPGVKVIELSPQALQGQTAIGAFGLSGIGSIAGQTSTSVGTVLASLFDSRAGSIIASVIMGVIGGAIGTSVVPVIGTAIGAIVGAVVGIAAGSQVFYVIGTVIGFLIISVALLVALFRLWFSLISAYLFILLDVVFAPFWIVVGLFPGGGLSFGLWFRDIFANLASFPVAFTMLLLGKTFLQAFSSPGLSGRFVPPMIGNPSDPRQFGAIIGLGMILLTPGAVNMTRNALKAPKIDVRPIAQSLGAGRAAVTTTIKDIAGDTFSYFKGNYPSPTERKGAAVIRRVFGRFGGLG